MLAVAGFEVGRSLQGGPGASTEVGAGNGTSGLGLAKGGLGGGDGASGGRGGNTTGIGGSIGGVGSSGWPQVSFNFPFRSRGEATNAHPRPSPSWLSSQLTSSGQVIREREMISRHCKSKK